MRVLFICKKNLNYNFVSYTRRSSGLWNSTQFIVKGLKERGVHAEIIEVHDNNDIDKEVRKFKPDMVVIEALWVVPEKFDILKRLHENVKWFVHLHSHIPFLALEGIAIEWLYEYAKRGVYMIANSEASYEALGVILKGGELTYLPNVYINTPMRKEKSCNDDVIDIGCFGAIRPLKNQLIQALAAIEFARSKDLFLRFHINGTRTETNGSPVLKNLIELFEQEPYAMLVQHHWHEPEQFIHLLHNEIDIGMQVSLTETFNVVTADYVTAGLPIVTSKEVTWTSRRSQAKDDSVKDIVDKMHTAWRWKFIVKQNQQKLLKFSAQAQHMWFEFVKHHHGC